MNSAPRVMTSVLWTGLLMAFGCPPFASADDDAVTTIKSLGAECEHDDEGNLIAVDFGPYPLATADDLALLKGRGTIVDVAIAEVNLSSDGFKHLASFSKLKRLDASGTKCTDADIRHPTSCGLAFARRIGVA